jgi:hypothetical protein
MRTTPAGPVWMPGARRAAGTVIVVCSLIAIVAARPAYGHDPRLDLPEPQSVPEAWDVIRESAANVSTLLDQGQLADVVYQIANTSPALRMLEAHADQTSDRAKLLAITRRLLSTGFDVINASREEQDAGAKTRAKWGEYQQTLTELRACYPAETVNAVVYVCPMHRADRHLKPDERCSICHMGLIRRHIPASSVYEKPGEPSIQLDVVSGGPLEVGKPVELRVRLRKKVDGSPVRLKDLVEVHTQKIHLLINDVSLSDYHHEHPRAVEGKPGEYAFTMTPSRPGPYRVWADLVPVETSMQEYVIADIPATTAARPLEDRETTGTAIENGRKYDLVFYSDGQPIRAGQTVTGVISVTGTDGKPFTRLEPIMGTFAHIVCFGEDRKTVLHIHPYGREPLNETDRGGPAFGFKFYAPEPGFYRVYGQVQIEGQSQFPAFGVYVAPAEKNASSPAGGPTTRVIEVKSQ